MLQIDTLHAQIYFGHSDPRSIQTPHDCNVFIFTFSKVKVKIKLGILRKKKRKATNLVHVDEIA